MLMKLRLRVAPLLLVLTPLACAPAVAPRTAASAGDAAAPRAIPTEDLHWVRGSAEYRAVTIQTFRAALRAAGEASVGRPAWSWAVCVDADETLIDNSGHELELQRAGRVHTDEAWVDWVKRRERTAVPGARAFLEGVRRLGGRVAVVTNTQQSLYSDVAVNLDALGLPYDVLVCRPDDGEDRKEGRFDSVANGTAAPGVGPVEILVWVGDNIQDFPGRSQALRDEDESAFAEFGVRFFALPNPIYGTWEANEPR